MKKTSIILTIILALVAGFIGAQFSRRGAATSTKETAYERVLRTGKIRCGYAIWHPMLYKDLKTGEIKGISHDIMEEIGKRLNLKIEWSEEASWGTIVEGLVTNRYDMICVQLAASSGRVRVVDFSAPSFYMGGFMVVRKTDNRFGNDALKLNDPEYKIAVLEGEMSSIIVNQSFPKAKILAMSQMLDYSMLLKEVETGKADATLMEGYTFAGYDKNNPGKLKAIGMDKPVNIFPVSFGLPQDDLAFKRMFDITLEELVNDGSVDRIVKPYDIFPGTILRMPKPYEVQK